MNYKIISDEKKLKDFIEWLPELLPHETYYVSLLGRKKYSSICENKVNLKRFTSDKTRLFNKIQHFEVPLDAYLTSKHLPVAQEALVVYLSLNPRNVEAATKEAVDELLARSWHGHWH